MVPAAVIAGHVYDEDGEPVVYAQVMAMHYAYQNGQRQLVGGTARQTNYLGEFRLFGLSPGQYYVRATLRANRPDDLKTREGYLPIYYPGVADASRAALITVRGGDEFSGIDINLQPVRTFTVRGHVLTAGCGSASPGGIVFLTEQSSSNSPISPTTVHDANGQRIFEFASVAPGAYYLTAMVSSEGGQCVGRQTLEVADADIEGVAVAVTRGVEMRGRVRVEGQLDSNLGSFSVSLSPKNTSVPFGYSSNDSAKPDGSFLLKNVYDGDYELNVGNLPENYFLKSARLDGVDVLTGVTVDTKQAPGLLDLVVSPNGASVDGVVSKDQQPFQGATVALVPDPPHRSERRLFKSTGTDQNGHFLLQGISPGDYKVFAWESIEPGAYTSSDFLQPYEKLGESVHITEGSRNSVSLELIPRPEGDR
jgi:hypothetical protein